MDQVAKDRYKLLQSYIGQQGLKEEHVQQLLMKIEKNRWGNGDFITAIFPFSQFFNHACIPNVFSVKKSSFCDANVLLIHALFDSLSCMGKKRPRYPYSLRSRSRLVKNSTFRITISKFTKNPPHRLSGPQSFNSIVVVTRVPITFQFTKIHRFMLTRSQHDDSEISW